MGNCVSNIQKCIMYDVLMVFYTDLQLHTRILEFLKLNVQYYTNEVRIPPNQSYYFWNSWKPEFY